MLITPDQIPYHYKLPLDPLIVSSEPSLEHISPSLPLRGVPKTKGDTPPAKGHSIKAKLKQPFKSRKSRLRLLRKSHKTALRPSPLPNSTSSPGTKPYVPHLKKGKHNNTFANGEFIPNLLTLKAVNPKNKTASVDPTIDFCASCATKGRRLKPHYHTPQHQSLFTCKTPLQQVLSLLSIRF